MPTIDELSTITLEKADKAIKDLGVSAGFVSTCLGLSISTYSSWRQTGRIPDKHKQNLIEVLIALKYIKGGYSLRPVDKNNNEVDLGRRKSILETLDAISYSLEAIDNKIIRKVTNDYIKEAKEAIKLL